MASGLAAVRELQRREAERAAANSRPEVKWFKWPAGVNKATFRFLQEIDENSPNYRTDRGLAEFHVEHQGPSFLDRPYLKRATCTAGDADGLGACYACERNREDYKTWPKARTNLYINVLVDFGDGKDPQVMLVSRPFNNSFVTDLIQESDDEGSITDANYRVIRTGEKTTTKWSLKRMKDTPLDDSNVTELNDIENGALRNIPYEKQEQWYTEGKSAPVESEEESSSVSQDTDW